MYQVPSGSQYSYAGITIDKSTGTVYFAYNNKNAVSANTVYSFVPGVSGSLTVYSMIGPVLNGLGFGTIPHHNPPYVSFPPTSEVFAGILTGVMPLAPVTANPGDFISTSFPIADVVVTSTGIIYATSAAGNIVYRVSYFITNL